MPLSATERYWIAMRYAQSRHQANVAAFWRGDKDTSGPGGMDMERECIIVQMELMAIGENEFGSVAMEKRLVELERKSN